MDQNQILAMDINRENYDLGLPIIKMAGVAHKIDFREGPASPVLNQMVDEGKYHGTFDFIFVDADKDNYLNYHKRLIELVKIGGVIGYYNTLWNGSVVAPPDAPLRKYVRYYRDFVLELNKAWPLIRGSRFAGFRWEMGSSCADASADHNLKYRSTDVLPENLTGFWMFKLLNTLKSYGIIRSLKPYMLII